MQEITIQQDALPIIEEYFLARLRGEKLDLASKLKEIIIKYELEPTLAGVDSFLAPKVAEELTHACRRKSIYLFAQLFETEWAVYKRSSNGKWLYYVGNRFYIPMDLPYEVESELPYSIAVFLCQMGVLRLIDLAYSSLVTLLKTFKLSSAPYATCYIPSILENYDLNRLLLKRLPRHVNSLEVRYVRALPNISGLAVVYMLRTSLEEYVDMIASYIARLLEIVGDLVVDVAKSKGHDYKQAVLTFLDKYEVWFK